MRKIQVVLACLTAQVLVAQTTDYEQWSKLKLLSVLNGLPVLSETSCAASGIESSVWAGTQDRIAELHGGLFSPYDGLVFPNYHYVQIEHIVARKEADESGLCHKGTEKRKEFAADVLNLTFAPGSLNASKGDNDAHDLQTAESSLFRDSLTEHAKCWWVAQTIRVKSKYGLRVDTRERTALRTILNACRAEQVFRPQLPAGADWVFHPEFLEELNQEYEIGECSEPVEDQAQLVFATALVPHYLPETACIPHIPGNEEDGETAQTAGTANAGNGNNNGSNVTDTGDDNGSSTTSSDSDDADPDPRADQIAAQNVCIATLEAEDARINCTNIRRHCPDVEPIQRGEPLYGSLRDPDNDGVTCESL